MNTRCQRSIFRLLAIALSWQRIPFMSWSCVGLNRLLVLIWRKIYWWCWFFCEVPLKLFVSLSSAVSHLICQSLWSLLFPLFAYRHQVFRGYFLPFISSLTLLHSLTTFPLPSAVLLCHLSFQGWDRWDCCSDASPFTAQVASCLSCRSAKELPGSFKENLSDLRWT